MIALTVERRESIAETLRGFMPEIDEPAIQRALFAIWPPRFKGEVCSICNTDLATRPILRTVRNSHYTRVVEFNEAITAAGHDAKQLMPVPESPLSNRRVRMKPVQLVITARIEGSHGIKPEAPEVFFRVCMKCFNQVKP